MKSFSTYMNFTSIRYLAVTDGKDVKTVEFDYPGKIAQEGRIKALCENHAKYKGLQFVSIISHVCGLQRVKLPIDIINKYKERIEKE